MTSGEHTKGHTELPSVIWMRDLDGTGSMHPCAKGDPGAITYVPEDSVNTYPAVAELVKALETAIRVADEARVEWDRAPSGMKAGKLLIALSDPALKYRADITEMHAALTRFREAQAGGGA